MISQQLKGNIEQISGSKITGVESVTGGCISQAFRLMFTNGESLFLKINPECCNDMFIKEANGLKELDKSNSIRVPKVILADQHYILLENIKEGKPKKNFFAEFGNKFSQLHRKTNMYYGFYEDNFIGSNIQLNIPEGNEGTSWADFYMEKRIIFQYKIAETKGYATEELKMIISGVEKNIHKILSESQEQPSLLHGDLWSGNYITDENGSACLIDPAVYYGHREADLGMTKLFGGFNDEFYNSYNEGFPLLPGYKERENIYKLYHALNHLNLFGNGYYNMAMSLAKSYK